MARQLSVSPPGYKRRRLELKAERLSTTSAQEGREAMPEVDAIPPARLEPVSRPVSVTGIPAVFFDLETTGLDSHCHITQIAAVGSSGRFSNYVLPKKAIEAGAQKVTGISCVGGVLFHHEVPVPAVPLADAMDAFLAFLGQDGVVLHGHNCKTFDCPILINAVRSCGRDHLLKRSVAGFVDTLPLFQNRFPKLWSHKQKSLYKHVFNADYPAHDAAADAAALQRLVLESSFSDDILSSYSFSCDYVFAAFDFVESRNDLFRSYQPLITEGVFSKEMAHKAAVSGLSISHLVLAFRRDGRDGVETVLSELTLDGKPRVSKSKPVLNRVSDYIAGLQ